MYVDRFWGHEGRELELDGDLLNMRKILQGEYKRYRHQQELGLL